MGFKIKGYIECYIIFFFVQHTFFFLGGSIHIVTIPTFFLCGIYNVVMGFNENCPANSKPKLKLL